MRNGIYGLGTQMEMDLALILCKSITSGPNLTQKIKLRKKNCLNSYEQIIRSFPINVRIYSQKV